MPTAFQFNSTQIAEIQRLRDIAAKDENKQLAGGGVDLYSYIFKCATGIDLAGSILSSPIDTVWQANGNAPMPDENRKALTWLYGALQVNKGVGAFSEVIREYNIRQGELRGMGTFNKEQLDEASNAVAVLFADSILNPKLKNGVDDNPSYLHLPTVQEIGNTDLNGVRDTLYPGNETPDKELYLNQAWPGIVMLGALGGQYTDRLLHYNDSQPMALDSLADFKSMLFAWDSFKTAYDKTSLLSTSLPDALIALNWPASFVSTAVSEYATNGATSLAQFIFSTLAASQNGDAKKGLDTIAKIGSNKFLDMLMGATQGKSLINTTTDATFTTRAKEFFNNYGTTLQTTEAELLPTDASSLAALAKTDVNVRAALAALSGVSVAVSTVVADTLSLYDAATGQGLTDHWLQDRSAMLSWVLKIANAGAIATESNPYAPYVGFDFSPISSLYFSDVASGEKLYLAGLGRKYFIFGSDQGEAIYGGSYTDHLYGGAGNDTINGAGGADYLEGGTGNDVLHGDGDNGDSSSFFNGDPGNDTLEGGAGEDTLIGGAGNDRLLGSVGTDTYTIEANSGTDTIVDTDGAGTVVWGGVTLAGGQLQSPNYWVSTDGQMLYSLQGSTLVVTNSQSTGSVRIENWSATSNLGITLSDQPAYPIAPQILDINGRPDLVYGSGADENISTGAKYDVVLASGGNDRVFLGAGNDRCSGSVGNDWIEGQDDNDYINGGLVSGTAELAANDKDTVIGGVGNDLLNGGIGDDLLIAGNQGDNIDAPGLDTQGDWLLGGYGNDKVLGSNARDMLNGGSGRDVLVAGSGDDIVLGDANYDFLASAGESVPNYTRSIADAAEHNFDPVYSIKAADAFTVMDNNAFLFASSTNTATTSGETDFTFTPTLARASGQVRVVADAAGVAMGDVLFGGAGNDWMAGQTGDDQLFGGEGNDILYGDDITAAKMAEADQGNDFIDGGAGLDRLFGGAGNDLLLGGSEDDQLSGQAGQDHLFGEDGADSLDGGDGNDQLFGGAGNDTLQGGAGADTLDGGTGLDDMRGGEGDDSYVLALGDAANVVSKISDTSGNNVLQLVGGVLKDMLLTGSGTGWTLRYSLNDTVQLSGSFKVSHGGGLYTLDVFKQEIAVAKIILTGGAGADSLSGGDGNDYYYVDNKGDVVSETTSIGGIDTVYSSLSAYTLGANVENGRILATGTADLTGNELDNVLYAGAGNNVLDGLAGTDTVSYQYASAAVTVSLATTAAQATGGSGSDTLKNVENLTGSSYADSLTGNADSNTLDGGAGNDTLNGGAGADIMTGGDGSDTYYVDNLGDEVRETNSVASTGGTDHVHSYLSAYTLGTNVENGRILATGTADLTGNELANVLYAGAGSNVLDGLAGTDTVSYQYASAAVTVSLATTAAQATGGSGSDTLVNVENLTGSSYTDSLAGNAFANTLNGGAGADIMTGGDGSDTYYVDNLGDEVRETNSVASTGGTDLVNSYLATYTLGTNVENGRILATGTADLIGNELANVLYAGAGSNMLDGAAGTDTVSYQYASAAVTVSLATTAAQLTGGSGSDTLVNVENLTGSSYADTLTGNAGSNVLNGGAGADQMTGGTGNDTYVVDNTLDIITEAFGEGTDTVQSSATYTLSTDVENLTLTGTGVINGTGNILANVLTGNSAVNVLKSGDGNDTLNGGAGADQMTGGTGNDTYVVDNTLDIITEAFGEGTDTVQSSATYTLSTDVENLTLTGTGVINGTGNILANVLTGNSAVNVLKSGDGNDTLNGGAGADQMTGGTGNDTYVVDNTLDIITEAFGEGTDTVQSSATYTLSTDVENLTLTGTGVINGTGNTLANVLTGNSAVNVLNGDAGNDVLTGGLGADKLTGGTGADLFDFNALAEMGLNSVTWDTITDFKTSEADKIDLLGVDANTALTGDQAFSFLGSLSAFTGDATGKLRFDAVNHILYGSTDSDTDAEFAIALTGVNSLSAADFIL